MTGARDRRLSKRSIWTLPAGTPLYRNHDRRLNGLDFNPCRGAPTLFAPLFRPDGACIPSLCLGETFDVAAYETVFRGPVGPFSTVPRQQLDRRAVTRLVARSDIRLILLFAPELIDLGQDPADFFATEAAAYTRCRSLAEALWVGNPTAQGLVWPSIRDTSGRAILLFGDRVVAGDLTALGTETVDTDPSLLGRFVETAKRAGYRIAR